MGLLDIFRTDRTKVTALEEEVKVLREQMNYSGGSYDPDSDLSAQGGGSWFFSPLSRSERELNPFTFERSLSLAYTQYESNPLAKAILEITRDYVLGEGIVITATDTEPKLKEELEGVKERFWNDDVNQLDVKLFDKVLELGLFGEQIYPVTVNKKDGHVRLGYVDPVHVSEVLTNPENVEEKVAIKLKQKSPGDEAEYYKIINEEEDPNDKWFARLKDIEDGESYTDPDGNAIPYKGACFYFAINKVTNAKRGRSDLMSLIDWIDAYDQMLFNEMDRATLLKNFVWDVKMQGATDKSIEEYKQKNPAPKPGSVRYHSDKVEWQAVTPDLKVTDAQGISDLFVSYIGTGARMPKTWLNADQDVNRATAQELGEPAFKRLTARQKIVKYMIAYILRFVFDQAEIAGRLTKREKTKGSIRPNEWQYRITMPELRPKDLAGASSTLSNCVSALIPALQNQILDVQIAQEVLAVVIAHIGVDINIEQLRERLIKAAKEQAAAAQEPGVITPETADAVPANGTVPTATNGQGNTTYYQGTNGNANYWQA